MSSMAPPEPGDAGNPFQSLLGDLMNMLGHQRAEPVGDDPVVRPQRGHRRVRPKSNVDPVQRIRLEQLARVAELNVTEATGMPVSPDGRRLTCVPVGHGDWTLRALESWRPLLVRHDPGTRAGALGGTGGTRPVVARSVRRR